MDVWTNEYREIDDRRRSFHNRLALKPSAVEASIIAVLRDQNPFLESNPFLIDSAQAAKDRRSSDGVEEGFDVDRAMRSMAKEDRNLLPGYGATPIPAPNVFAAIGNAMKLAIAVNTDRHAISAVSTIEFLCSYAWPFFRLTTAIVSFPKLKLTALRQSVLDSCDREEEISSMDVIGGLLWTTICDLRDRPLPGQESSDKAPGHCSLACDLRLDGPNSCVPLTFFGNASCFVHVSGRRSRLSMAFDDWQRPVGRKIPNPLESNPFLNLLHREKADKLKEAVVSASRRIARAREQLRKDDSITIDLVRTLWSHGAAPWTSRVSSC